MDIGGGGNRRETIAVDLSGAGGTACNVVVMEHRDDGTIRVVAELNHPGEQDRSLLDRATEVLGRERAERLAAALEVAKREKLKDFTIPSEHQPISRGALEAMIHSKLGPRLDGGKHRAGGPRDHRRFPIPR